MKLRAILCGVALSGVATWVAVASPKTIWYVKSYLSAAYTPPRYASSVAWYKFDTTTNSSGKYTDYSRLGTNYLTPSTTAGRIPTWTNAAGGSLSFDGGDNARMDISVFKQESPLTIAVWVRPAVVDVPSYIFSATYGASEQKYIITQATGKYKVTCSDTPQGIDSLAVGTNGVWAFLVMTMSRIGVNNNPTIFYVNGLQQGTATALDQSQESSAPHTLGAYAKDVTTYIYSGLIGDFYATTNTWTSNEQYQAYIDTKSQFAL